MITYFAFNGDGNYQQFEREGFDYGNIDMMWKSFYWNET